MPGTWSPPSSLWSSEQALRPDVRVEPGGLSLDVKLRIVREWKGVHSGPVHPRKGSKRNHGPDGSSSEVIN